MVNLIRTEKLSEEELAHLKRLADEKQPRGRGDEDRENEHSANLIVAAAEDPMAPLLWLTVKLTVYLGVTWLAHATLSRPRNPRGRSLLWHRAVAVGSWSWSGSSASRQSGAGRFLRHGESGIVTRSGDHAGMCVTVAGNGPAVERGTRTDLASGPTADRACLRERAMGSRWYSRRATGRIRRRNCVGSTLIE